MSTTTRRMMTLGEMKAALRTARTVYVWVNWQGDDGDYLPIADAAFLRGIGADTPNDGAHGGRHDGTAVLAEVRPDGDLYVG